MRQIGLHRVLTKQIKLDTFATNSDYQYHCVRL
jgi:hypothetical protein